jgi:glycosyltransferase involved in cell wall biosynthesis
MKIAALTSGRNSPAGRFRIRQHIPSLAARGVEITEKYPSVNQLARLPGRLGQIRTRYLPPVVAGQMALNMVTRIPGILKTWGSDAVWIERSFIPGIEAAVHLTRGPRFLDVDDAIWMMNPLGESAAAHLARSVDTVIAGNSFLADWYGRHCSDVRIVPTAVDCGRYRPKEVVEDDSGPFVIGWTGTSGNFPYFEIVEAPIARFMADHSDARLLIVADRAPSFRLIPADRVDFEPWTPESEASVLHRMTIGIMPLADTPWARGKCSFKMLQYMASALPAVVSPVGMNADVLAQGEIGFGPSTDDDWYDAMDALYRDRAAAARMGGTGREVVERKYSASIVSAQLAGIFLGEK